MSVSIIKELNGSKYDVHPVETIQITVNQEDSTEDSAKEVHAEEVKAQMFLLESLINKFVELHWLSRLSFCVLSC